MQFTNMVLSHLPKKKGFPILSMGVKSGCMSPFLPMQKFLVMIPLLLALSNVSVDSHQNGTLDIEAMNMIEQVG